MNEKKDFFRCAGSFYCVSQFADPDYFKRDPEGQTFGCPDEIPLLSPVAHGLKAFWDIFINHGGILEGKIGREIARESYVSEYLAYRAAQKLKRERGQ